MIVRMTTITTRCMVRPDEVGMIGGYVHLICSKPPLATPDRLASPDLGRFPSDSLDVFGKSENGLFHICWVVSL